jgi:hypothetical protein
METVNQRLKAELDMKKVQDKRGSLLCPKCKAFHLTRVIRKGWWENLVLRPLGYRPWRCSECRARFYLKHKGNKARSKSEEVLTGEAATRAFLAGYKSPNLNQGKPSIYLE